MPFYPISKTFVCFHCKKESISHTTFKKKYCENCKKKIQRKIDAKLYYQRHKKECKNRSKKYREKSDDNRYFSGNRLIVLIRDNFICKRCGKKLVTKSSYNERPYIHHIDEKGRNVPKKERNNSIDNLVTLCLSCHTTIHNLSG